MVDTDAIELKNNSFSWSNIGLNGHTIGTFNVEAIGIIWKSVMTSSDDGFILSRMIPATSIQCAQWTVFARFGHLRIQSEVNKGKQTSSELRFDGFPSSDFDQIRDILFKLFEVKLSEHHMSATGCSYGNVDVQGRKLEFRECLLDDVDEDGEEFEPHDGYEMMSMALDDIAQCVLPGNSRNEIEVQFHESDTVEMGTDQLVGIRFYIPPDLNADPSDRDAPTSAELFQQRIMKEANIKNTTGDVIVEFDETMGTFLTPRGRYSIELYHSFLRMRGAKYDYKIKYDDISRLFLLPRPDDVHMAFVISLDKPIRQGQQRYQMLVLQTTKEIYQVSVNLDEKTLHNEYNGELQPIIQGALCNLVAKTFKIIGKKKVFIPGKFTNAYQQPCVKCALRANEGHLYPLEKSFVFIHKPPLLVRFDEVESVEFQRYNYAGKHGSTRNFDLCVELKSSLGDINGFNRREFVFSGIDRSDYGGLYNFLSGKKIKIKNIEAVDTRKDVPDFVEDDVIGDESESESESESEDEDFESDDGDRSSSDEDSDDNDPLVTDENESDLEVAHRTAETKAINKIKESITTDNLSNDDRQIDKKNIKRKRNNSSRSDESIKKHTIKKEKDSSVPKRAMSSFMFFSKEVRSVIKEENPNANFGEIGKLVGKAFKNLSGEEKKKFETMANEDRQRYKEEKANYDQQKSYGNE